MDYAVLLRLLQFVFPGFTDRALEAMSVARDQAAAARQTFVTPEHILAALSTIEAGVGRVTLEQLGIDFQREATQIMALASVGPTKLPDDHQILSSETERLLSEAKAAAKELGHNYVGTEHLVLGILRCGPCPAGDYLRTRGITVEMFSKQALELLGG